MSYKIIYHTERYSSGSGLKIAICAVLLFLSILNVIGKINHDFTGLREQLLPWTQPHIRAAYKEMLDSIANGSPVVECMDAFCDDIFMNETTNG